MYCSMVSHMLGLTQCNIVYRTVYVIKTTSLVWGGENKIKYVLCVYIRVVKGKVEDKICALKF